MDLSKTRLHPKGPPRKPSAEAEAELVRLYRASEVRPKALRTRFGIPKATLYRIVDRCPVSAAAPAPEAPTP